MKAENYDTNLAYLVDDECVWDTNRNVIKTL